MLPKTVSLFDGMQYDSGFLLLNDNRFETATFFADISNPMYQFNIWNCMYAQLCYIYQLLATIIF